ncbi:putative permease [Granulicella aggregans]|uniref:Putative permease n=1 Tax=Granulicella aggregans TaxID=474949 RepID=A0A7W7ZE53_9BACT|nr:ABC transporter permease [Granulicella aggregans]MBB5058255.1 putative permease [Granulicella aggregans]
MTGELASRLRFFFRPKPIAAVNEELRAHIDAAIDANLASGMSPAEARRKAIIDFGAFESARESAFDQRPSAAFDRLRQDIRYCLRTLRRDRGFTAIAVVILALGIAANVVVFSLVDTILLRPLPFAEPDRLAWIAPADTSGGLSGATYSSDAYDDFRAINHSFTDITGYFAFSSPDNIKITGTNSAIPQPITGIGVLGNFLNVLGVTPVLGRNFTPAEAQSHAAPVVLLSYPFWKQHFHSDASIIGKAISLDNHPTTVVGVLPSGFDFGAVFSPGTRVDVLTPTALDDIRTYGNTLTLIGRMKPGITLAQASADARLVAPQLYWGKRDPTSKGAYGPMEATGLKEHVAGQLRRSLNLLWVAVGLILLIVCVNLSNLLIARAATRSKEFALRVALGANRARLVRQLLTESAILSIGGAALGLLIAFGVTTWLAHQGSLALPLLATLHIDTTVLLWTLLIALVTTLLLGLAPGIKMSTGNLHETLKDSGTNASDGRKNETLRTALVISEVALACVLLVGAGLLLRSFLHVLDIDLGFRPAQGYSIQIEQSPSRNVEVRSAFYQTVLSDVSSITGIEAAGLSDNLPLTRNRSWGPPGVKGVDYPRNARPGTLVYVVSPGYLPAMGMKINGRDFSWHDTAKTELGIILNKKATDFLFPGQDPIGRMVEFGGKSDRIVGVVPDVHADGVESDTGWQVYLDISQDWGEDGTQLVVRSRLPADALAPVIMAKLRALNPGQPAATLQPLQQIVDHATSPRRFFAVLVAIFAALGLVLASLGIYGVISYTVTRQTQEIGIRMALGASQASVQRRILKATLRMTAIGVAIGAIASLTMGKLIASLLFATEATDPTTFAATVAILIGVALIAAYLPARRASRINPMTALRNS